MKSVKIYTDGASIPNPGKGGWSAIILFEDRQIETFGCEEKATSNRMEMMGAIKGLEFLREPARVEIYSDSMYLVKTMNDGWKRKKNKDLWIRLDNAIKGHKVSFIWVKGHSGLVLNELADSLANKCARIWVA